MDTPHLCPLVLVGENRRYGNVNGKVERVEPEVEMRRMMMRMIDKSKETVLGRLSLVYKLIHK
jgi:hypothetical protein